MDADQISPEDLAVTVDYHRRLEENRLDDVPLCRVPTGWQAALSAPIPDGR